MTACLELSISSTVATPLMFASMPLDVNPPPEGHLETPREIPVSPAIMLKLVDAPATGIYVSSARHVGFLGTFVLRDQ